MKILKQNRQYEPATVIYHIFIVDCVFMTLVHKNKSDDYQHIKSSIIISVWNTEYKLKIWAKDYEGINLTEIYYNGL